MIMRLYICDHEVHIYITDLAHLQARDHKHLQARDHKHLQARDVSTYKRVIISTWKARVRNGILLAKPARLPPQISHTTPGRLSDQSNGSQTTTHTSGSSSSARAFGNNRNSTISLAGRPGF